MWTTLTLLHGTLIVKFCWAKYYLTFLAPSTLSVANVGDTTARIFLNGNYYIYLNLSNVSASLGFVSSVVAVGVTSKEPVFSRMNINIISPLSFLLPLSSFVFDPPLFLPVLPPSPPPFPPPFHLVGRRSWYDSLLWQVNLAGQPVTRVHLVQPQL